MNLFRRPFNRTGNHIGMKIFLPNLAMVNRCIYYITGHGYGHATRSFEMVRALVQLDWHVTIVSTINPSFVTQNLGDLDKDRIEYQQRVLDSGAVQIGPLELDLHKTLDKYYYDIHMNHDDIVKQEESFIRNQKATLVITDVTPAVCNAARQAGALVIIISNLTWDCVYKHMLSLIKQELLKENDEATEPNIQLSSSTALSSSSSKSSSTTTSLTHESSSQWLHYEQMIHQIEIDYNCAHYHFRLPGPTPIPHGFENNKIIPSPLLSRPIKNKQMSLSSLKKIALSNQYDIITTTTNNDRNNSANSSDNHSNSMEDAYINLTQLLKDNTQSIVQQDNHILILSFGGHNTTDFQLQDSFLPSGWICILLGFNPSHHPTLSSTRWIFCPSDIYVPDIMSLGHVFLGKIGYGTVSECLSTTPVTPLLYIPRDGWNEEFYLTQLLSYNHACVELSKDDFYNGKWEMALKKALMLSQQAQSYQSNPSELAFLSDQTVGSHSSEVYNVKKMEYLSLVASDASTWIANKINELTQLQQINR